MALDKQTVCKIGRLARIYVDEVDIDRYALQLSTILEFVEQMNQIDTENVVPLSHPQDRLLRMRDDSVTVVESDTLGNAPRDIHYIRILPAGYTSSAAEILIFNTHFKAGSGSGDQNIRDDEAALRILQMHRGSLRLDSQPGRGSTFTMFLPVSERETTPAPEEPEVSVDDLTVWT